MEQIIIILFVIFFICLFGYLSQREQQKFDIAMEELRQSRAISYRLREKKTLETPTECKIPFFANHGPDKWLYKGGMKEDGTFFVELNPLMGKEIAKISYIQEKAMNDFITKSLSTPPPPPPPKCRIIREGEIIEPPERPRVYVDTNQLEQKM